MKTNFDFMKRSLTVFVNLLLVSVSVSAQYSLSVNYGNVDWIPKANKVLAYENVFVYQSYSFGKTGISVFEASSLTKAPNQYELAGIDYAKVFGNIKTRIGFHGYFPKSSMFHYTDKGNLIPTVGIVWNINSTQALVSNIYQYWDYKMTSNFFSSNLIYKKNLSFGNIEFGQYYNFKSSALSGTAAYSKSWPITQKLSGFASLRFVWNESRVKQNTQSVVVNFGLEMK
jgi:hypothetical protein